MMVILKGTVINVSVIELVNSNANSNAEG